MRGKVALGIGGVLCLLLVAAYVGRHTSLVRNWHPMLIEPALAHFGLTWMGHDHDPQPPKVAGNELVGSPVTTCWNYDFLELHCDGPDHYKAFADGSKIGAYKGTPSPISPSQATACAVFGKQQVCVTDDRDDGETVWLDTGRPIERYTLVECPGPRFERLPCTSRM